MGKDYYSVLGVGPDASDEEIKHAYRTLARKYHPDAHPGDSQAEARFKDINEAHTILSDPTQRREYDLSRAGQTSTPGPAGGTKWNPRVSPSQSGPGVHVNISRQRKGGVVTDLNVNISGLSAGLRVAEGLLGGLERLVSEADKVLSEADKAASGRRTPRRNRKPEREK